jgi:nicotinamidase/pyrazinamidase
MGNNNTIQIVPSSSYESKRRFILAIIDVQNDFCSGGALAVKGADDIIAPINKLRFMYYDHMETFISLDYHNPKHMSFGETHGKEILKEHDLHLEMEDGSFIDVKQTLWPVHCVENTPGSNLHRDLVFTKKDFIVRKGTKRNVESYSAFGDEFRGKYEKTELSDYLKSKNITDIILTGLATDYCVYNTALDARRQSYEVHLIMSCTRGVGEETTSKALNHMIEAGVKFYTNVDDFYNTYKNEIIYSNHTK